MFEFVGVVLAKQAGLQSPMFKFDLEKAFSDKKKLSEEKTVGKKCQENILVR